MDIDIVVLGRSILVLAVLGGWAGWHMAAHRGLNRVRISVTALILGLLPPLNLVYLLFVRRKRPKGDYETGSLLRQAAISYRTGSGVTMPSPLPCKGTGIRGKATRRMV